MYTIPLIVAFIIWEFLKKVTSLSLGAEVFLSKGTLLNEKD